ncbi:MAG: efflux RND transporter periplasmic adaptor subunit [Bacteroidetes bacterium]|jgi:membrane fusion protein (multidrug efflux system)|nr:efflux RND transporter periplasmic adaptor subunit [Bacteroidota bacterium]
MMPSRTFIFPLTLLLLFSCKSSDQKKNDAVDNRKQPMKVNAFILHKEKLENIIRSTGTVIADESVDLKAEMAGRITGIFFKEGTTVHKGDLLVKIYDDDIRAQIKKTEEQINLNQLQLNRQEAMLKINATSQQDYDVAKSQVETLKADLQNLQATLQKASIRAPFDGVIGLRYVSEGGYVNPQSQIASLQRMNTVKVDFSVPEKYSNSIRTGDTLVCTNEASHLTFKAKVYAMDPKITTDTRSLQLRAIADNKNGKILPGSYVRVDVQAASVNTLMVPTETVIPVLKGQTVFAYRSGKAQQIPIKTGIRTDTKLEVLDGLNDGDTIITTGIMFLRPDMNVELKEIKTVTGGIK